MIDPHELATALLQARDDRRPVARLTSTHTFSMTDAYSIQSAMVEMLIERGEVPAGLKLGFTSLAKAQEMGVDQPVAGVLTDHMAIANGGTVETNDLIHPRIEPELAFRLDLRHEGVDLWVCPALEIIDSRFTNFDFDATDVVADNASCAAFIVGEWTPLPNDDAGDHFADAEVSLRRDAEVVGEGRTSAILGHPRRALDMARSLAAAHSLATPSEGVLLAGAATQAIPLQAGHRYTACIAGLGDVSVVAR